MTAYDTADKEQNGSHPSPGPVIPRDAERSMKVTSSGPTGPQVPAADQPEPGWNCMSFFIKRFMEVR